MDSKDNGHVSQNLERDDASENFDLVFNSFKI